MQAPNRGESDATPSRQMHLVLEVRSVRGHPLDEVAATAHAYNCPHHTTQNLHEREVGRMEHMRFGMVEGLA